jgi:hypothetical protein
MILGEKIIGIFRDFFKDLSAEGKRRLVLYCTGVFVFILVLSVIFSMAGAEKKPRPEGAMAQSPMIPIPGEEIFLPQEPDFIPGVLLEREKRDTWTERDASEYWQDPLRNGEEQWRGMIDRTVDTLLEHIP